jgi:hypothetical protein
MSIRIQNGDIFVSSNHKNVILSTDFAPLICYPLNNFSVTNTLIFKKKLSGASLCFPTQQDLQGLIFPLQLDKMEKITSFD